MSLTSPVLPEVISRRSSIDSREEIEEKLSVAEGEVTVPTVAMPHPAAEEEPGGATEHRLSPIAAVVDFLNTSCAQYDKLIENMGLVPRGIGPPGCLFHWARNTADGLRIIEVWRDRDSFERHLAEKALPVIGHLRLPEPDITVYDVHNYLTAGSQR